MAAAGQLAAILRRQRAHPADQLVAVLAGQPDVAQQHRRALARDQAHRLVGAVGGDDDRAALLQHLGQQLARVGLVVDQQHLDPGQVDHLVAGRPHRAGLPDFGRDGDRRGFLGADRQPQRERRAAVGHRRSHS